MICERCRTEDTTVTDRRACNVAHCDGECLANCQSCQSDMADDYEGDDL